MSEAWRDLQARWRRFDAWERAWLRAQPVGDPRVLRWASEAWHLARVADPTWGSFEDAVPHWRAAAAIRRALARASMGP